MEETKVCAGCGRELPLSEFSGNRFGQFASCKKCVREKRNESMQLKKISRLPTRQGCRDLQPANSWKSWQTEAIPES